MLTFASEYSLTITAIGLIGVLALIQLLVADILGIIQGHTPGTSIEETHDSLLFRAVRSHANTNETIATFIGLAVFAIAVNANPIWINNFSLIYIIGRIGHMLCYYTNLKILRSVAFAISLVALFGIAIISWSKWLGSPV